MHWRRVERRVELIIGRSARIAALFPSPHLERVEKGKREEKAGNMDLREGESLQESSIELIYARW